MRRALVLAIEQGLGREAALLHNNFVIASWSYEGSQAALVACRDGIDFCERRGITEFAVAIESMSTTFLAQLGQIEEALNIAGPLADRLESIGDILQAEPRSLQLRLFAERGAHEEARATDELLAIARKTPDTQASVLVFSAATQVLLTQGHPDEAAALLSELEQVPDKRWDPYYVSALPQLVRAALAVKQPELAAQLLAGVEPRTPLTGHTLCTCRAQLADAAGHHAEGARLYAEAADRWAGFGNVPERAYALLGQGRCLHTIDDPAAEQPLTQARDLFAAMGYTPALTETRTLLDRHQLTAS